MYKEKNVVAIIVAGGKGTRMGEDRPKQYLLVDDKYILEKTIEQFEKNSSVDEIILVVNKEDVEFVKTKISCEKELVSKVIVGGEERINSVYNGLMACDKDPDNTIVMIHDGVRPFASQKLINNCIEATCKFGACVPVIDMVDTIKHVENDTVKETLDRSQYKAVQTPQGFNLKLIRENYEKALEEKLSVTDDSSILEHYGVEVKAITGLQKNIKITTQFDLKIAELISRMV